MTFIGRSHRHHLVPHAQVEPRAEAFLKPELLQSHLAAPLQLLFIFAGLFALHLHRALHAAMLEFNLTAETPAVPEIIPDHEDRMGQIHQTMAAGILVTFRTAVAEQVVTKKIVFVNRLAVPANGQPGSLFFLQHAVCGFRLAGTSPLRCRSGKVCKCNHQYDKT